MKIKGNIKIMLLLIGVVALTLLTLLFSNNMVLFDPKGVIGLQQERLIITSALLMAIIIIPVLFMIVYFPYKYRHSNHSEEYKPKWEYSIKIEAVVWTVPCLIIIVLAWITYQTAYSLDPRKEIVSDKAALTVQVVAMNWKWLFIYPEQQVATVNELAFTKCRISRSPGILNGP